MSEKTDIFGGAALTAQAAPQQATPKGDEDLGGLPVEAQSLLAAFDRSETVGLCILNRHHRLVHANQTFARLIGRTPDRLVGERLASFLDQESVATAREALNAVSRGEPPGPNTLSLISSQGQPVEMRTEIWFIDGRFGRPYLLMLAHPLPQAPKAPEVEEDDQSTVTISRAEATALINQTVRQAKAAQERLVAPPPPAGPQATSRDRALASGREKMLHAILKSLPDTVFVLDKAARIATVWSPETTIAGHSATRVHGMHIGQLFQPSDTLRLRQAMRLARGRRQARALIVQPARKRPGSDPTYLELRFSDLGPGGTIVIMRDVTVQHHARVMLTGQVENLEGMRRAFVDRGRQLTRLADRLTREKRRSERIKATRTHFLATVSHEFRTPLNAILGFAEILHSELLGPLGNQRYRRYARDILESGNLLLSLVDTVMSYEQAVSERLTLEPDRVELKEVINEVLGLLGRWASSLGISLEVIDPPIEPVLYADGKALRQMLVNLISNAVKFSGTGNVVRVSSGTGKDGKGTVIEIEDHGIGMTEEEVALSLRPFGQVAEHPSGGRSGIGIGLPLTRHLIEEHGGRLSIESSPGKGTKVRLVFPASSATLPPVKDARP